MWVSLVRCKCSAKFYPICQWMHFHTLLLQIWVIEHIKINSWWCWLSSHLPFSYSSTKIKRGPVKWEMLKCDENIFSWHDLFTLSASITLCHFSFLPINWSFHLSQTFFVIFWLLFFKTLFYMPAETRSTVDRITDFVE